MTDLADYCLKEPRSGTRMRSAGNLLQITMDIGEMNTGYNRLRCEFVCKKECV